MQLHVEVARGALDDAGVAKDEVDGFFSAGLPGLRTLSLTDYLGLHPDYTDTTDYGGSSYLAHVGHAVSAIRDD
jgi:acetyl-CoA C-acetyltransferase